MPVFSTKTCYRKTCFAKVSTLGLPTFLLSLSSFCQVPIPQFKYLQPIELGKGPQFQPSQPSPLFKPQRLSSILKDSHAEQNACIVQQANRNSEQTLRNRQMQRLADSYLTSDEQRRAEDFYRDKSVRFQQYFNELLQMSPDDFSITKAVYLVESAWYHNPVPFEKFEEVVQSYADVVLQILKREGLDIEDDAAINYGVQKLYKQDNVYYDSTLGKTLKVAKLGYDFNDYMGDKDWSKQFVYKLLAEKKGQCHSLPLLYLCIVERLHGKAYLSLTPNHSFIQYFDRNGKRYHFETTNGNHVTERWLQQSTFVSAAALANKTYLDTLSGRQLHAQMLGDLLLGYKSQLAYDNVTDEMIRKIQSIDANNMTALMVQARIAHVLFKQKLHEAGNPTPEQWHHYPALIAAYDRRQALYQRIDATGHQEMPRHAYQQWLASMEQEAQKQQDKAEYDKLLKELNKLKHIKPTLKQIPKQ